MAAHVNLLYFLTGIPIMENSRSWTPLHEAVAAGQVELVPTIIKHTGGLDIADELGSTAAHLCCTQKRWIALNILLHHGANPNKKDQKGKAPLHVACEVNAVKCCRSLLVTGAAWDAVDMEGKSALLTAVENGNTACIIELLKIAPHAATLIPPSGWSLMHDASSRDQELGLKILSETPGIILSTQGPYGLTCLHLAAYVGSIGCTKYILSRRVMPSIRDAWDATPLHWACHSGHKMLTAVLIRHGAAADYADCMGRTALHTAAMYGNSGCLNALLARGVDPMTKCSLLGRTPLHYTAQFGHFHSMELLLNGVWTCKVNAKDCNGTTPLFLAARLGNLMCCRLLLESGASVHVSDKNGTTPIQVSCMKGHPSVTGLLLTSLSSSRDPKLQLCLMTSAQYGAIDCLSIFISRGVDVNYCSRDKTPFMEAASSGSVQACQLLVAAGAKPFLKSPSTGRNAIHVSAISGSCAVLEYLISLIPTNDVTEHLSAVDINNFSAFHFAAIGNHTEFLSTLLSYVPCPRYSLTISPLHCAVQFGHFESLTTLIENIKATSNVQSLHSVVLNTTDKNESNPLHWGAHFNQVRMISYILESRGDSDSSRKLLLNSQDNSGQTALHKACSMGNKEVVLFLLTLPDIDFRITEYNMSWSAVHYAASKSEHSAECLNALLLNKNCDATALTSNSQSALHIAAKTGGVEGLGLLIRIRKEIGIDPNMRDSTGLTALEWSCLESYSLQIVTQLASVTTSHGKALHLAATRGNCDVISVLLNEGWSAYELDEEGRTPCHFAAAAGHVKSVSLFPPSLLSVPSQSGATPLLLASHYGRHSVVESFLTDFQHHDCDTTGRTFTHYAARRGHLTLLKYLIEVLKLDYNVIARPAHRTPFLDASASGKVNVVQYLLKLPRELQRSSVATKLQKSSDLDGNTALHLATKGGHPEVVALLLKYGWSVYAENMHGWTPAKLCSFEVLPEVTMLHRACQRVLVEYLGKLKGNPVIDSTLLQIQHEDAERTDYANAMISIYSSEQSKRQLLLESQISSFNTITELEKSVTLNRLSHEITHVRLKAIQSREQNAVKNTTVLYKLVMLTLIRRYFDAFVSFAKCSVLVKQKETDVATEIAKNDKETMDKTTATDFCIDPPNKNDAEDVKKVIETDGVFEHHDTLHVKKIIRSLEKDAVFTKYNFTPVQACCYFNQIESLHCVLDNITSDVIDVRTQPSLHLCISLNRYRAFTIIYNHHLQYEDCEASCSSAETWTPIRQSGIHVLSKQGFSLLEHAVLQIRHEIVSFLFEKGITTTRELVSLAMSMRHVKVSEVMPILRKEYSLSEIDNSGLDDVNDLSSENAVTVFLRELREMERNERMKFLSHRNSFGRTSFHCASKSGRSPANSSAVCEAVAISLVLVELSDDDCEILKVADINGNTPLHDACWYGTVLLVRQFARFATLLTIQNDFGLTAAHVAALSGHTSCLVLLLLSPNVPCNSGLYPIHYACKYGHVDCVAELINSDNSNKNIKDATDCCWTPLHYAAYFGRIKVIEYLMNNCGVDVNTVGSIGDSPLQCAIVSNHDEALIELLRKGAVLNHKNITMGQNSFHISAELNSRDCLVVLLSRVSDTESHKVILSMLVDKDFHNNTLLHTAALHENPGIIELLYNEGTQIVSALDHIINNVNTSGDTALHLSCVSGCFRSAEMLINEGALPNINTRCGLTALHLAVGSLPSLEMIPIKAVQLRHQTSTMSAVLKSRSGEPLRYNLDKCNISSRKIYSRTIFPKSPQTTRRATVRFHDVALVEESYDTDDSGCDDVISIDNNQLYQNAKEVKSGACLTTLNLEVSKLDHLVLSEPSDIVSASVEFTNGTYEEVDVQYEKVGTVCRFSRILIKKLICNNCDIEAKAPLGITPAMFALQKLNFSALLTLLQYDCDPIAPDVNGDSLMHIAIRNGELSFIKALILFANSDILFLHVNKKGDNCFHEACINESITVMSTLLLEQPNCDIPNSSGCTPLYLAIVRGCLPMVEVLIDHGCELCFRTEIYSNSLHCAASNNIKLITDWFIEKHPFLLTEPVDDFGNNFIHFVVSSGLFHLLSKSPDCGKLLISGLNVHKHTPLHTACLYGVIDVVQYVVRELPDSNVWLQSSSSGTPLVTAIASHRSEVVAEILNCKRGKLLESVSFSDRDLDNLTPVEIAVREGYVHSEMSILLQHSIENCNETLILHLAALSASRGLAALEWLLKYGTDAITPGRRKVSVPNSLSPPGSEVRRILHINMSSDCGDTPLHAAVSVNNLSAIRLLLSFGADINRKNNSGDTPAIVACCSGAELSLRELIKWGADLTVQNSNGKTAANIATEEGFDMIVNIINQVKPSIINSKIAPSFKYSHF